MLWILRVVHTLLVTGLLVRILQALTRSTPVADAPAEEVPAPPPEKRRAGPLVEGLLFLIVGALFFAGLTLGTGDDPLVGSRQWLVWRFAASVGVAVAVLFSYRGWRAYRDLPATAVSTGAKGDTP